mmetsp:Transcript_48612/g.48966  ORF Transcript_48612/g.48966 Transcript_48612/m.48966 type:complete len:372 (-) Transcript_48612:216-1331(-)
MSPQSANQNETPLPKNILDPVLMVYRSTGIGIFGVLMRWGGMPLEKIALFLNSSQVAGKNQFRQSIQLTFADGALAPYRVVGRTSIAAWFFQYSVMGMAFQFFDRALSEAFGVRPMYYGKELMDDPSIVTSSANEDMGTKTRFAVKTAMAPFFAAYLETAVANRAEVERFFGPKKFAHMERQLNWNTARRFLGPAFFPGCTRNVIMCNTTFIFTPVTYRAYFPQEHKSSTSLFWFGLGSNMFVGNVVAITQQALWGRSLDYMAAGENGARNINYTQVIKDGLKQEGAKAFFTPPKWFARVLMNAPAQGLLPWFYNEVLPIGEGPVINFTKSVYGAISNGASSSNDIKPLVAAAPRPELATAPELATTPRLK